MRILHIDTGLEMRGGQWQVLHLLRGLRERGIKTHLMAAGALLEQARGEGFDANPIRWTTPRHEFDLIHAHDSRSHTRAVLSLRPAPTVVSRRVTFPIGRGVVSKWKYAPRPALHTLS